MLCHARIKLNSYSNASVFFFFFFIALSHAHFTFSHAHFSFWGRKMKKRMRESDAKTLALLVWIQLNDCEIALTSLPTSGIATVGGQGGRVAPPWQQKKNPKIGKRQGENQEKQEKEGKSGKRGKSLRFFHFAPPDRYNWLRYFYQLEITPTVT